MRRLLVDRRPCGKSRRAEARTTRTGCVASLWVRALAGNRVGLKPDPQGLDASPPCGQGFSLAGNRARPVWDNSRPMRDHDPMRRAPLPRVACVLGTRPEAVKMAPVIFALRATGRVIPVIVNTGQHRELLSETMSLFALGSDVAL